MVGILPVSLDPLPMKRVLAIEENGSEHLPPELAPEEKSRFLLQRIDFEQSEKDAKKAKSSREASSQSSLKWPWQGLTENLKEAHQELSIILDFLTHVEANDAIMVASMVKPKQLHEACSELALRASVKLNGFKKVGKYLKQTAKALEQQVEQEATFYGALMRLQQHWKVKRLRGISAGPGGSAGFSIDLSYPQLSTDIMSGLSSQTAGLYTVNVKQDSSGLLMAHLPGHHIHALHMQLLGPYIPRDVFRDEAWKDGSTCLLSEDLHSDQENTSVERRSWKSAEKSVGEAVNEGARMAHSVLRCIQTAIVDEQIFEWTAREALQPSSGLLVTSIWDNSLQLSLGHSSALVLELLKIQKKDSYEAVYKGSKDMEQGVLENRRIKTEYETLRSGADETSSGDQRNNEGELANVQSKEVDNSFLEMSAMVCLQQAFYHSAFVYPQLLEPSFQVPKPGQVKSGDGISLSSKVKESLAGAGRNSTLIDPAGALKHFSLTLRHKIFCSKVLRELEKLVRGVPYLSLSFHPTWHARRTAWDLKLEIPQPVIHGWKMRLASWSSAKQKPSSKYYFQIVLSDALLSVEGLEAMQMQENTLMEELKMSKYRCDLLELPSFLLCQLAGQLIKWLYEEALVMGLKVRKDLLSLFFSLSSQDDIVMIASLDVQSYCINWWLQLQRPKMEDGQKEELSSNKSHSKRFLGSLNLETLRGILVDFLNSSIDDS